MDLNALRASVRAKARLDYARSGGPGGQNVNKVNSKVIARIRVSDLEGLSAEEVHVMKTRLRNRLTVEGELVVGVDQERDQVRNKALAYEKLVTLVAASARINARRIPTAPTPASRRRRLETKRVRSRLKKLRGTAPD